MIAVPITKKFSWHRPPFITILLIVVNCFVFIVFQQDDSDNWIRAHKYYIESGLGQLEFELYHLFLEEKGKKLPALEGELSRLPKKKKQFIYYQKVRENAEFLIQLSDGNILNEDDPRMIQWRELRPEYDSIMDQIVAYRYGFRPAHPRPFTWLSHMFLHSGWDHLIGNMIFLWLVGCLIEYGCRHTVFPIIYLLGGLAGTGLFYILNANSNTPLVGASGAISGIMGAFTVFYGLKKVRIFLSLGFYFNYITFSAIVLLPFWMSNELYQLFFNHLSPVAYAAHFGGLGAGAILAFAVKSIHGCLDNDAFEAAQDNQETLQLERALEHMGRLEYDQARKLFLQVLDLEPDNIAIWKHLYTIDQQNPDTHQFHQTAAKLLELLSSQHDTQKEACTLFNDYLKKTTRPKLGAEHYLRMSNIYLIRGRLPDAQRLLFSLVKKKSQMAELPSAIFKLAQAYQSMKLKNDWIRCLKVLLQYYPMSNESQVARQQLGTLEPAQK